MSNSNCTTCGRPVWDGGHAINDRECTESGGEICWLTAKVAVLEGGLRDIRAFISEKPRPMLEYFELVPRISALLGEAAGGLGLKAPVAQRAELLKMYGPLLMSHVYMSLGSYGRAAGLEAFTEAMVEELRKQEEILIASVNRLLERQ